MMESCFEKTSKINDFGKYFRDIIRQFSLLHAVRDTIRVRRIKITIEWVNERFWLNRSFLEIEII